MEAIEIDFDPDVISYGQLLAVFWEDHDPCRPSWSRQYASAILFRSPEQEREARRTAALVAEDRGKKVETEIAPFRGFTRAEDYHQKWYLRQRKDLLAEIAGHYPATDDLVDSTAAARLNGYAGGNGDQAQLRREIDLLGLSEKARATLLEAAGR